MVEQKLPKLLARVRLPELDASVSLVSARDSRHCWFSMYFFYVIESESTGRFYKGHTADIVDRLKQHNSGKTKSTKSGVPWRIVYKESFSERGRAVAREKYFKTLKGGKELKLLLKLPARVK